MDAVTQPDRVAGFADIVASVLEVDPADVTDAAGPHSLPTWTSLRHLQLVVTLEESYGVSFSYAEIRDLKSIGDVHAALLAKGVTTVGRTGKENGSPVVD